MNPSQLKSELEADYIKIHNQLFPAGVKLSKVLLNVAFQNEIDTGISNLNSGILSFSSLVNSFKNSLCFVSSVIEDFLLNLNFFVDFGLNVGIC